MTPPVTTTNGERLARVEEKLDGVREDLGQFLGIQQRQADKIEGIEKKINSWGGIGAAALFIITFWDTIKSIFK